MKVLQVILGMRATRFVFEIFGDVSPLIQEADEAKHLQGHENRLRPNLETSSTFFFIGGRQKYAV